MDANKPTVILCVDDDKTVLHALRTVLRAALPERYHIEIAESGEEALEICADYQADGHEISLVVSDFIMPNMRGDELLVKMHSLSPKTVKIMLTGQSDLEGVRRAINDADLYRFLGKPFDNADLAMTVKSALHAYAQEQRLVQRNAELEHMNANLERLVAERTSEVVEKNVLLEKLSLTDRLTGLYNRRKLDQVIADEMLIATRYVNSFSAVLIDIDFFKSVNDTFGHLVGDQVLVEFASLLTRNTRAVDVLGRWGGEEFLIFCRCTDQQGAMQFAEKLRHQVESHVFATVGTKTCSLGVASCQADDTIESLLARADEALYRAKANGRNRVEAQA